MAEQITDPSKNVYGIGFPHQRRCAVVLFHHAFQRRETSLMH